MTTVNLTAHTTASGLALACRHPQRISVSISWALHQRLIERSDYEGRSLSNLAAHLLETALPRC